MWKNKEQGFTLLELMATIVVFGVLVSFAVPSFRDMIERQKIRSALNEWQNAFFFAQKEAMRLKEPIRLCASANGTTCNATVASKQFNRGWIVTNRAGNTVLQDYALNEPNISIFLNQDNGLIFRSNGSVAGVTNAGSVSGGFFSAQITVGPAANDGSSAAPDVNHRNTIRMDISSGGRLIGARR